MDLFLASWHGCHDKCDRELHERRTNTKKGRVKMKKLKKPTMLPDGRCPKCVGGLCDYHKEETSRRWLKKEKMLRRVSSHIMLENAGRIMIREELESDEAGTATDKAIRILNGYNPIPRHMMVSGV